LKNELFPIFEDLSKDDQDSVRVLAVEAGIILVSLLRDDPTKLNAIKPIMKELAADRSWRSRYMIAERIVEIQEAFKDKITLEEIVQIYTNLLKDSEGEVRDAAASKLQAFCNALPEAGRREAVINEILSVIRPLTTDANQHVKIALASVIMGLAPILGQENTVTHLLPIFLSMLHDDTPEVRLNIISSLDKVRLLTLAYIYFFRSVTSLAATSCRILFCPLLLNWPRMESGAFAWLLLNTCRCWLSSWLVFTTLCL
jgi:serine/threonine-protein phosphatase 2A regulatory subunit A